MKFHLIIDHPSQNSFNYQVLKSFIEGIKTNNHEFDILDLNKEQFNPIMSARELALYSKGAISSPKIKDYQQRLVNSNYLALFFPIWWMVMPARLKGWMDKVLQPGFAFTNEQIPKPLLTHISGATVFTTTAVADEIHRQIFNNALESVLCKGTLNFIGIKDVTWLNFGETGIANREKHSAWLEYVKEYAAHL
jgi:NAD(P)H dehydrogenase (quinone)